MDAVATAGVGLVVIWVVWLIYWWTDRLLTDPLHKGLFNCALLSVVFYGLLIWIFFIRR